MSSENYPSCKPLLQPAGSLQVVTGKCGKKGRCGVKLRRRDRKGPPKPVFPSTYHTRSRCSSSSVTGQSGGGSNNSTVSPRKRNIEGLSKHRGYGVGQGDCRLSPVLLLMHGYRGLPLLLPLSNFPPVCQQQHWQWPVLSSVLLSSPKQCM